jgi:ABC-type nitrate/sulfonate/bicarbonate transport system ATPase subunit
MSREFFGVDEPLLMLDERLRLELQLELESLWPANGLLGADCVCSCMKES